MIADRNLRIANNLIWLYFENTTYFGCCVQAWYCPTISGFSDRHINFYVTCTNEPDVGFEPTVISRCLLTRQVQSASMGIRLIMSSKLDSNQRSLASRASGKNLTSLLLDDMSTNEKTPSVWTTDGVTYFKSRKLKLAFTCTQESRQRCRSLSKPKLRMGEYLFHNRSQYYDIFLEHPNFVIKNYDNCRCPRIRTWIAE